MHMPPLQTERLVIRPFTMDDLDAVYQVLDVELRDAGMGNAGAKALNDRRRWLQWTVLNYNQLARLYQPPYGERAVVLPTGEVIGAAGMTIHRNPFPDPPWLQVVGVIEQGR